jgi:hypothetical protein
VKKLFLILLILVYGVSSSGMTLHIHYCCGKIDRVDVVPVKKDNCAMGHDKPMKNCCDEKQLSLKLKSEQNTKAGIKLVCKILQPDKIHYNNETVIIQGNKCTIAGVIDSYHPPAASVPPNILHCVFRI